MVLARLLEILLIETLRSTACAVAPPGLLRGLADDQLALALRRMHERPTRAWTVVELARGGGAVALGLLRPVPARGGCRAHGVPAGLAHGPGQGSAAPREGWRSPEVAARVGHELGQHLQRRLRPLGRHAADRLCARATRRLTPSIGRDHAAVAAKGCGSARSRN
ncbi:hypothetical protein ACRAWD_30230 [Caulobacter segnis]